MKRAEGSLDFKSLPMRYPFKSLSPQLWGRFGSGDPNQIVKNKRTNEHQSSV